MCLVDKEEGRSEKKAETWAERKMGQTGSRVATKIANSFTFHGSPRFNVKDVYNNEIKNVHQLWRINVCA